MSMQEEVSQAGTVPDGDTDDLSEIMALAVQEVEHCLRVTDDSLPKICSEMEGATSELMIRPVFRRFNSVTQIFLRLVPAAKYSALISKALYQLGASPLLLTFLDNPHSIEAAIQNYKSSILGELAALISTSALERTKKPEMLKTSGLFQKDIRKRSFAEQFHDAEVRVDLGLAAHKAKDTLLFGKKVMSAPGFLSAKNITDIQNNNVEGATTWSHQNAFCKMIIAG